MAYTTKAQLSLVTNTTTIPGDWVDVASAFEIASNALAKRSGAADGNFLYNGYSELNQASSGEGDQKIKYRFVASSGHQRIMFRYTVPGGTNQYILTYVGLAGGVRVDAKIGGTTATQSSANWGLTNGVTYDAEVWVEGTVGVGNGVVFTCNIYNTSGTLVFTYKLGTGGTAWTNTALLPATGRFQIVSATNPMLGYGGVNYVEFLTQGSAGAATATVSSKNSDRTSGGVILAIAGGVPPYSVAADINGVALAGSPFAMASAGNLTLSKTGLSEGVHHRVGWTVTPTSGTAVSSSTNFFTEPFDLAYLRTKGLRMTAVGDSITADDTRPITIGAGSWTGQTVSSAALAVAAAAIGGVLGTALETSSNRVSVVGYTTEQIADLADQIVDVINGGYSGPNTAGGAHPADKPAMLVPIRLFKNDTVTPAESMASLQSIIDAIRAGCPHNPWIILGRVTGHGGSGVGGAAITADRQYSLNLLLDGLHDPDNRIVVESMVSWWPGVLDPTPNIPDGIHPDGPYRGVLVMNYANTIIEALLGLMGATTGSGGAGSLINGGLIR